LVEHEGFAGQYSDPDERIINASRCQNEGCDTGRVPPRKIESQYDTGGDGSLDIGDSVSAILFQKKVVGAITLFAIIALVLGVPLATGSPLFGGGQATTADTADAADFSVETREGGPVITDGEGYITPNGSYVDSPHHYDSPDEAWQVYSEVTGAQTGDINTQSTSETADSGDADDSSTDSDSSSQSGSSGDSTTTTDDGQTSDTSTQSDTGSSTTTVGISASDGGDWSYDAFSTGSTGGDSTDGDSTSATLTGVVYTQSNQRVAGATVKLPDINRETTTNDRGEYTFTDIPAGDHTISAFLNASITPIQFTVESNGQIKVRGEPKHAVFATGESGYVRNNQINLIESGSYDVSITGTGSDLVAPLTFSSISNADNVTVRLSPESENTTQSYTAFTTTSGSEDSSDTAWQLPDDVPNTQNLSIASPTTEKKITLNGDAKGNTSVQIPGNLPPEDIRLTLNNGALSSISNISETINSSTRNTSIPLAINGDLPSNVTVDIVPNTTSFETNATGNLTPATNQREIQLAGNDPPDQLSATIKGRETFTDRNTSASGESNITITYLGNRPAVGPNETADPRLTITSDHSGATNKTANGTISGTGTIQLSSTTDTLSDEAEADIKLTGHNQTGSQRVATFEANRSFDPAGNTEPVGPANQSTPELTVIGQSTFSEESQRFDMLTAGDSTGEINMNSQTPAAERIANASLTFIGNTTRGEERTDTIEDASTFVPKGTTSPEATQNATHPQLLIDGQEDTFERSNSSETPLLDHQSINFETGTSADQVSYDISQTEDIRDPRVVLEGVDNTTNRAVELRDVSRTKNKIDVNGTTKANVTVEVTGMYGGLQSVSNTSIAAGLSSDITTTAVNSNPPSDKTHITYVANGSTIHAYDQDWSRMWSYTDLSNNVSAMTYSPKTETLFTATTAQTQHYLYNLQMNPTVNGVDVSSVDWKQTVDNKKILDLAYYDGVELVYAATERGTISAYNLSDGGRQWTHIASETPVFDLQAQNPVRATVSALDANGTLSNHDVRRDDTADNPSENWKYRQFPSTTDETNFQQLVGNESQTIDVSGTKWAVFEMGAANGTSGEEATYPNGDGGLGGRVTALVDLRGIDSVTAYGANGTRGYNSGSPNISEHDSWYKSGRSGGSAALMHDDKILIGLGGGGGGGGGSAEWSSGHTGPDGGDAGPASGGDGGRGAASNNAIGKRYAEDGGTGQMFGSDRVYIMSSSGNDNRRGFVKLKREISSTQTTKDRNHLAIEDESNHVAVARSSGQTDVLVRDYSSGNEAYRINETGFSEIHDIRFNPQDTGVMVSGQRDGSIVTAVFNATGAEIYTVGLRLPDQVDSLRHIDGGFAAIGTSGQITEFETTAAPTDIGVSLNGSDLSIPSSLSKDETASDSLTVSPDQHIIETSVTGAVDINATWTDTTETINPEISVKSDGTESPQTYGGKSVGTLQSGNTTTLELNTSHLLGNGTVTISAVSSNTTPAGRVNATIKWNESWGTEMAKVSVGDYTGTNTSVIYGPENDTHALPNLPNGSHDVEISHEGGPAPKAHIKYVPVYQTAGPKVDLTGDGTADVNLSGTLVDGEHSRISLNESQIDGNVTLNVTDIEPTNSSAPTVDLRLNWTQEVGSHNPTVSIGDTDTTVDKTLFNNQTETVNQSVAAGAQDVGLSTVGSTPMPTANISYRPVNGTDTVAFDIGGNGTFEERVTETLTAGETTNVTLPVSNTTETINVTASGAPVTHNTSYQAATGPHNITVTDRDGSTVADRTRPLLSGQSMNRTISITEDRRFNVTADGNASALTTAVSYRARNATESVEIESTGDGESEVETSAIGPGDINPYTIPVEGSNVTIEAAGPAAYELNYSATSSPEDITLTAGNSSRTLDGAVLSNQTVTLRDIDPATNELAVNSTRAGFNLSAKWANVNTTADPTVKYNGEILINESGGFGQQRTVPLGDGALPTGNPTLDFQTERGSISYTLNMTARAAAEYGKVILDDKTWRIQEITEGPVGQTHSRTPTKEINTAESGTNDLYLTTQPVSNLTTKLRVKLTHGGAMKQSTDPKVTVVDPAGNRHTRTIADPRLEDGELTEQITLSLPQSWFGEGTNTVQVVSQNGTEVTAELTATGVEEQTRTFD
jgi:hypothetical protein